MDYDSYGGYGHQGDYGGYGHYGQYGGHYDHQNSSSQEDPYPMEDESWVVGVWKALESGFHEVVKVFKDLFGLNEPEPHHPELYAYYG